VVELSLNLTVPTWVLWVALVVAYALVGSIVGGIAARFTGEPMSMLCGLVWPLGFFFVLGVVMLFTVVPAVYLGFLLVAIVAPLILPFIFLARFCAGLPMKEFAHSVLMNMWLNFLAIFLLCIPASICLIPVAKEDEMYGKMLTIGCFFLLALFPSCLLLWGGLVGKVFTYLWAELKDMLRNGCEKLAVCDRP
jgi:hypothetical protein